MSDELHVLIEVFAPPGEAYSRMSHALEEIKKFLVPVSIFHFLQRCFSSVPIKNVPLIFTDCWGPAPADPGYSKWGRRRRPINYLFITDIKSNRMRIAQ